VRGTRCGTTRCRDEGQAAAMAAAEPCAAGTAAAWTGPVRLWGGPKRMGEWARDGAKTRGMSERVQGGAEGTQRWGWLVDRG